MTHYPKSKVSKVKAEYLFCWSCIQLQPVKFKLLAFWRKKTPFIGQKYTYENVTKNLGRALPPLIWTKSKRTAAFMGCFL